MKLPLRLAALCLCVSPTAQAAAFSLGYERWDYDISGIVEDHGARIDLERDLEVEVRSNNSFALRWDTGPGWWRPDLAADYFKLDAGGRREVTSNPGGPLPLPDSTIVILADADLDDFGLTLRYPAQLGASTLWGGVTIKRLDGTIVTRDEDDTQEFTQLVDETFPMLHAEWLLPLWDWLSLGARADWVSYDGNEALELRGIATARVFGRLDLSAGWRRKHYLIDSPDYRLDTTLDGALLGIGFTFGASSGGAAPPE